MIRYKKSRLMIVIATFLLIVSTASAVNRLANNDSVGRVKAESTLLLTADKNVLLKDEKAILTIENKSGMKESDKLLLSIPDGLAVDEDETKQLNDGSIQSILWHAENSQLELSSFNEETSVKEFKVAVLGKSFGSYQLNVTQDKVISDPLKLTVEENTLNKDLALLPKDDSNELDQETGLDSELLDGVITPYDDLVDFTSILQYPNIRYIYSTEPADKAPEVIPGKNAFVMQLSKDTEYEVVGADFTNEDPNNTTLRHLKGAMFMNTASDPAKVRYVKATKVGFYKGKWVDVKLVVDEVKVLSPDPQAAFGVSTIYYNEKDLPFPTGGTYGEYFMSVGSRRGSMPGDIYKYHYEFYENGTEKQITGMSGMWNFQKINELKSVDILNDGNHMSDLYAKYDSLVHYRKDTPATGFDRFWGKRGSTVGAQGEETYLTNLFNDTSTFSVTMTSQTIETSGRAGMMLMYNQTPLARIYPSVPEVIGSRTKEDPMRLKYEIYQNVPDQKVEYYSNSFSLSTDLPAEYDFDLSTVKIYRIIDDVDVTNLFTASYNNGQKNKLLLTAVNSKDPTFNGNMYRIKIEAAPNSTFDFNEYLAKTGARDKQYNQATGYLQVPLSATNTFDTGNTFLGTGGIVSQTSEIETPDQAISYMLYKGLPLGDPVKDKTVAIGSKWESMDAKDFVENLRSNTGSPVDEPVTVVGFEPSSLPDTSKKGSATVVVNIITAQNIPGQVIVPITIANADPIPTIIVQGLIKNNTQNLAFAKNQTAHIQDQLTFQAKVTKDVAGSIWSPGGIISMTVPDGVQMPTIADVTLTDGTNKIPATIKVEGRKIIAELMDAVTTTSPLYLSFDTSVLDAALGKTYSSVVEVSGEDSNQNPLSETDTAQLTVLDYSNPEVSFAGTIEKQAPDSSWEVTNNAKPESVVRYTIQATLDNDYAIWKNQKISVTIPDGLANIQLNPTKAVIVRPGQADLDVTADALTTFSVVGNKIVFETSDPKYQFDLANSRIRFSYTATVLPDAVEKSPLKTLIQISGVNSRNEIVSVADQYLNLNVTPGQLDFTATDQIDFGTNELISSGSVIRNPTTDFTVDIKDTRGTAKAAWAISAEITKPFTNGSSVMNGDIMFVNGLESKILGSTSQEIYRKDTPLLTNNHIVWESSKGQGLFLNQKAGQNLVGAYSGEITWTLSEGP